VSPFGLGGRLAEAVVMGLVVVLVETIAAQLGERVVESVWPGADDEEDEEKPAPKKKPAKPTKKPPPKKGGKK
jgi:hypothetical protein